MVQQSYSLRRRKGAFAGALSHEDLHHPAAAAAVGSGLRPGMLTLPAEKKRFYGNRSDYLEARDLVLLLWDRNQCRFLTEDACLQEAADSKRHMVREAYRFLHQQGCINIGILRDDPLIPLPEGFLPLQASIQSGDGGLHANGNDAPLEEEIEAQHGVGSSPQQPAASVPDQVTDEAIEERLYEILGGDVDWQEVTPKMLRARLAEHFGIDMSSRKAFIKDCIEEYLAYGAPPPNWRGRYKKNEEMEAAPTSPKAAGLNAARKRRPLGRVIVIGAGPAGLAAALHLKRNNVAVTVLEARGRVGGRVNSYTAPGFSAPVDLGASIITGTEPDITSGRRADPSALLCKQLGVGLHPLTRDLPIYDAVTGGLVEQLVDKQMERLTNELMDDVADELDDMPEEEQEKASFGVLLDRALASRQNRLENGTVPDVLPEPATIDTRNEEGPLEDAGPAIAEETGVVVHPNLERVQTHDVAQPLPVVPESATTDVAASKGDMALASPETVGAAQREGGSTGGGAAEVEIPGTLTDEHLRVLNWNWANLEYGCSAPLSLLSATKWNQDERYGGFGGPHCMIIGGYDTIFRQVASLLDVRLNTPVSKIRMRQSIDRVEVFTEGGAEALWCDAVVVTAPLGVLKSGAIEFDPPLPAWKQDSIARLGFGNLNKVVLEFPEVFWDDSVDFFGAALGTEPTERGYCFMFWNFHRFAGAPILAALVAGEAAQEAETVAEGTLRDRAMQTLRAIHPGVDIPDPVACTVSRWGSEPFTRGSYSYVAVGATGDDYDALARPVGRRILFAGEHTLKEHPDTVGGAIISGVREAARALEILEDDKREGGRGAEEVGAAVAEISRKRSLPAGGQRFESSNRYDKRTKRDGIDAEEGIEYSDEEDMGNEEDLLHRRGDRAMGRDIERVQERMRYSNAAHERAKDIWRALMAVEAGNLSGLRELMEDSSDFQSRSAVVGCLKDASTKALETIVREKSCLKILTSWVRYAGSDSTYVALLDELLRTIGCFLVDGPTAQEVGLIDVVKTRCSLHSDPGIRKQASLLLREWIAKETTNGKYASDSKDKEMEAAPAKPLYTFQIELDATVRRELEEADMEARRLEELAASRAAEAAANLAQAEKDAVPDATDYLMSFEEYRKGLREAKKKPKAKIERISERMNREKGAEAAPVGEKNEPGERREAAVAASTADDAGKAFDLRMKVDALVSHVLQRHFKERSITRDSYKAILKKASEKIMAKVTAQELEQGRATYERRKKSIMSLTEEYVTRYKISPGDKKQD